MTRLLYFAQLRERTGTSQEEIDLPAAVRTGRELLNWLCERNPDLTSIFATGRIRLALDQQITSLDAVIAGAREIALFPPMTGG